MPEVFKFETSSYEDDNLILKKKDCHNDHLCLHHTISTSSETYALSDDTRDLITLKEEQVIWFTSSSDDEYEYDDFEYKTDYEGTDLFDKDLLHHLFVGADDETDTKENHNGNNNNDKNDVMMTMENNDCQNKRNEVASPTIQTRTRLPFLQITEELPILQITEEYTGIDNTISMEVSITPAVGHHRQRISSVSNKKDPKVKGATDNSSPLTTTNTHVVNTSIQDIGLLSPLDMNKRFFQDIGLLSRVAMNKKFYFF